MNLLSSSSSSYPFPLKDHNDYFENLPYKDIYLENSWLLIPTKLLNLIDDFLILKKTSGSVTEKKFYANMNRLTMLSRLFKNRPLAFVGKSDDWLLKDGTEGTGQWETIGTDLEENPLVLQDLMSYDELQLSSFLSISIFTPFINPGSRENSGKLDQNCQQNGIYIGQSGARFEKQFKMDWKFMIIDPEQNTLENGYGPNGPIYNGLSIWAKFYEIDYFPLYSEVELDQTGRFYKLNTGIYLDLLVYKKRVKILAEIFLKEANFRASKINKIAFCHVVGLGLGAWKLPSAGDIQTKITIQAYLELLSEQTFKNISDLYFSWFNIPKNEINIPSQVSHINIHTGFRNPADPLNDDNKLLVANWAWDANSHIGNEYWFGNLRASGDPAAACCSFISYLGNPDYIKEVHYFNTT